MGIFLAGGDSKPVKHKSHKLDATKTVDIYHPGYSSPKLLLILVAFEAPSGQRGVPVSVVLDSCRILANNRDGTLHTMMDADVELTAPANDSSLLPPGRYVYRVTGGDACVVRVVEFGCSCVRRCYAVCTSFRAWTPPSVLPPHWNSAAMGTREPSPASTASDCSTVVKMVDGRCAVTGDVSRLENSHLVPKEDELWWILKGMSGITSNRHGINSPPNCLALRADLNRAAMEGHLVFAPYAGTAVCVCLAEELADFAVEYHLRGIEMPSRIHPMNVYVRFAWGLFKRLHPLLRDLARDPSVVTIAEPHFPDELEGDDDDDDSYQESVLEPPLDVDTWTERDVEIAEGLDAGLDGRPLAPYEQHAGMYPGYSKPIRLMYEYRRNHPEVSAVRHARVARRGEDDDEQAV
ncbi:hypothetical protein B0H15DRAFT_141365 [Mycena belliarum]|uniref:HNH nuclease domain-containing protein n=1 Tax=Mycena belliarum TaxID=1033014 RepID=A0AAD6TNK5_9AGAR|nr:hypothetical protein B0H15DRAFT_141365 [Mycena belliae]